MKKFISLALSSLVLAACAQTPVEEETIKIGYIGPLTGDAATYGLDTLNGAELKVAEINAAGGIDGKMIEFIAEDARCTGADAASAAQKLIHVDKVVAIMGGICSGETLSIAPIANAAKIPMMSPGSTSPDITDKGGPFAFRNVPSDALAASATAAHLKEQGLTRVAVITENTDFAVAFARSLKEQMGNDSFVFEESVEPNTKDFRTLITRLEDIEFDVFVVNAQTVPAASAMLIQLREQGFEQPTVGNNTIVSNTLAEESGGAAEGLKVVLPPSKGEGSNFAQFEKDFTAKYGDPSSSIIYSALSTDVIGIFAEAISEVGTDGDAIRQYLNAHEGYTGAAGTFSFDENGDVKGIPFELQEVKDGEFVTVENIPLD